MWLAEQITERGLGNGQSLMIFFSIVERIWPETIRTFEALSAGSLRIGVLGFILIMMVFVVAGAVAWEVGGPRRPPQVPPQGVGRRRTGARGNHHIPL